MKFLVRNYLPPEPLTWGLPSPDPRSLCPLPSTEFVEPPQNKIPVYATVIVDLCIRIYLYSYNYNTLLFLNRLFR